MGGKRARVSILLLEMLRGRRWAGDARGWKGSEARRVQEEHEEPAEASTVSNTQRERVFDANKEEELTEKRNYEA